MHGIPKFAIPTLNGEPLIARHARLMRPHVERLRICTTAPWAALVADLVPDAELRVVVPSTMNDAIRRMTDLDEDYLIGMPDTYFAGPSPYGPLSELDSPIGIALWRCSLNLIGKVGQVRVADGQVAAIVDKDPGCDFEWMWGALRMQASVIAELDPDAAHPGIDLPRLIRAFPHATTTVAGDYIDCGTPSGVRDMLNQEAPWPSPTATHP